MKYVGSAGSGIISINGPTGIKSFRTTDLGGFPAKILELFYCLKNKELEINGAPAFQKNLQAAFLKLRALV